MADTVPLAARVLVLFGSAAVFGAERGNLEALQALQKEGAELLFLVRQDEWSQSVPEELQDRGLEFFTVPYIHIDPGLSSYKRFAPLRNFFNLVAANLSFFRIQRQFRPTHIFAYNQLFVFNFWMGLCFVKTPLVYRAGDEPTLHNRFWRMNWRFVVWRTHRFVANSRFVKQSLMRAGIDERRISLIYNAPPRRRIKVSPEYKSASERGLSIGFVGQITKHKGIHLLIDAFRALAMRHRTAQLRIAGRISDWEGDTWARKLRNDVAKDSILRDRVEFMGYIEDVPSFMAQCRFIVVPSLFEDPSPNVVSEARRARRAVIGFPRGGIPELIEHGVDGLVCADATAHALETELNAYLSEPTLADRHGAAGPRSLKRLEVDRFAEKWRAVLS